MSVGSQEDIGWPALQGTECLGALGGVRGPHPPFQATNMVWRAG